jgi:hypothetical protein
MASKETIGSQTAKAGTPPFLNADAAAAVQKAFLESCDQASRTWLARMQSEVSLWSDLANKLSGTKSMPEAFEAYSSAFRSECKWLPRMDASWSMNVSS